jgi:hypothetical protein
MNHIFMSICVFRGENKIKTKEIVDIEHSTNIFYKIYEEIHDCVTLQKLNFQI